METSVFLARIIGPLFVLTCFGFLMNPKHYRDVVQTFLGDPALYYLAGGASFILGMSIITFHNVWTPDWRIAITIVGWIALVRGVVRILAPTLGKRAAASIIKPNWVLYAAVLALMSVGVWLSYEGFARRLGAPEQVLSSADL
jgi:uncharacterized protein YjeT (DUF2065 family)